MPPARATAVTLCLLEHCRHQLKLSSRPAFQAFKSEMNVSPNSLGLRGQALSNATKCFIFINFVVEKCAKR
jgi:hypothetical protein